MDNRAPAGGPGRALSISTPEEAWGDSSGRGIRVAVVDSGVDASHPALGGVVKGGVDIAMGPDGVQTSPCSFTDECGHGTACAGIIADLAPEVELYSVKVLGAMAFGTGEMFLAGLHWAIENDMQVVNLSLGTNDDEYFAALHKLADYAYYRGTILVAAASNVPPPSIPSIYSSLISVSRLPLEDKFAFSFEFGHEIEIGARGVNVRVPWVGHGYQVLTGNSFAAPHITGLIARILAKHPGLTPFEIKSILYALARRGAGAPP